MRGPASRQRRFSPKRERPLTGANVQEVWARRRSTLALIFLQAAKDGTVPLAESESSKSVLSASPRN